MLAPLITLTLAILLYTGHSNAAAWSTFLAGVDRHTFSELTWGLGMPPLLPAGLWEVAVDAYSAPQTALFLGYAALYALVHLARSGEHFFSAWARYTFAAATAVLPFPLFRAAVVSDPEPPLVVILALAVAAAYTVEIVLRQIALRRDCRILAQAVADLQAQAARTRELERSPDLYWEDPQHGNARLVALDKAMGKYLVQDMFGRNIRKGFSSKPRAKISTAKNVVPAKEKASDAKGVASEGEHELEVARAHETPGEPKSIFLPNFDKALDDYLKDLSEDEMPAQHAPQFPSHSPVYRDGPSEGNIHDNEEPGSPTFSSMSDETGRRTRIPRNAALRGIQRRRATETRARLRGASEEIEQND